MTRRAALDSLAQGLELALVGVRQLLSEPDPEDWVNQKNSPLGRRRHCELARANAFPSARKVDGMWQVRRHEIDAYIESHPAPDNEVALEAKDEAELVAKALAYQPKRRRSA